MVVLVSMRGIDAGLVVEVLEIAALVDDGRAAHQHGRSRKEKNGSLHVSR